MAGRCPEELVQQFVRDTHRLTTAELAAVYNRAQSTIREWRGDLMRRGYKVGYGYPTWENQVGSYIEVEGDAIILSDLEIPDHSPEVLDRATAIAERFGIDMLVIAGDFLANDAFSHWEQTFVPPSRRSYEAELDLATQVLETLGETFHKIYIITGNHDARLARATKGMLTIHALFRHLEGVEVSWYRYMYLISAGERVLICHPVNYSRDPLKVARQLSAREEPRCHVVAAHQHHCASGLDMTGRYQVIDSGCARDPNKTLYKRERKTLHPEWNLGFAMVRNGKLYAFPLAATDWALWLQNNSPVSSP